MKLGVLTALLGALTFASAAASGSSSTTKSTTRGGALVLKTSFIQDIAASGDRIAVGTDTGCSERLYVWNPLTRRSIFWRIGEKLGGCPEYRTLLQVALDRKRADWLWGTGPGDSSTTQELHLLAMPVTGLKKTGPVTEIAYAAHGWDEPGEHLDNLLGKGGRLAFNYWDCCQPGIFDQKLEAVVGTGPPTTVASGAAAVKLVATDGERFATRQGDTVTILDRSGTVLRTIAITPGAHRGFALDGKTLAVLTNGKLEAYNTQTGNLTKSIRTASKGATLADLQSGLAVYVLSNRGRIHVVRLSDRRDRIAARLPWSQLVGAQLERAGLWYASNGGGDRDGRVVFLPWRTLQARLR